MSKRKHVNFWLPNFLTLKKHLASFFEFWYPYNLTLAQDKYFYAFKMMKLFGSTSQFLTESTLLSQDYNDLYF